MLFLLETATPVLANQDNTTQILFAKYDQFKEQTITHRRFKHKDIVPLIQALPFEKQVVGQSFEGVNIPLLEHRLEYSTLCAICVSIQGSI